VLKQVLDTVPQGIFWKDKVSVYQGCNEVFARAVGLADSEQIVGKTDFDLPWSKEDAEAYQTDDALVIATGTPKRHIVEPLRQSDGTRLWIDTSKMPLLDFQRQVRGVLGVYEDITERKRAEELMSQMETRFRSVIDSTPVPFALNDDHGNIGYLNPAFTRIFGYDINDISNLTQWWIKAYPDTTYRDWVTSQWQQRLDKARREAAPFEALEVNIRCKDGSQRVVMAEASSFADAFEMTHLVILYDITERKQSEKRIRQLSSGVPSASMRRAQKTYMEPGIGAISNFESGQALLAVC
jgi:PAS domain S-box-containing protein